MITEISHKNKINCDKNDLRRRLHYTFIVSRLYVVQVKTIGKYKLDFFSRYRNKNSKLFSKQNKYPVQSKHKQITSSLSPKMSSSENNAGFLLVEFRNVSSSSNKLSAFGGCAFTTGDVFSTGFCSFLSLLIVLSFDNLLGSSGSV